LDRSWQPKVTAISETRDLTTLTTAALFGKLREHELEKKTKSLALKTITVAQESTDESSGACSESEDLSLLSRKFQKFIKMNNRFKNQQGKRGKSKTDYGSTKLVCFGCGKQGHMKAECPSIATKDKAPEKKNNKSGKTRHAYISWEDNATSSSCSSEYEIEANMCMMAGRDSDVSSTESSASFNSTNYNTLRHAFQETHEEGNKLAQSNRRLKGMNNWLEKRVKQLEDELLKEKDDFENLEKQLNSAHSNKLNSSKLVDCENCAVLQSKVNYLISTALKLSMGTTNLNALLGSQNCVFEKAGIYYQTGPNGKKKLFNNFFKGSGSQSSQSIACFYCMKNGHSVRNCKIRKFSVPKGLVRWVPKAHLTLLDPSLTRYQILKLNMFCKNSQHPIN